MGVGSSMLRRWWEDLLIYLFVDNRWIKKVWRCHNIPERSFFVRGRQFHLCARCTGMFVGAVVSIVIIPFATRDHAWLPALLLPMPVDGMTQLIGLRRSTNLLRFATGLCFGVAFLPSMVRLF